MSISAEKLDDALKHVQRERNAWKNSTSSTGIHRYKLMCALESLLEGLQSEISSSPGPGNETSYD